MSIPQYNIDWSRYMEGLDGKADRDLGNLNVVTNCITEIPQDIQLDLKDGHLVIKAGSKVHYLDGTSRIVSQDITTAGVSETPAQRFFWLSGNTGYGDGTTENCFSGNNATMNAISSPKNYQTFFNTEQKKAFRGDGSKWIEKDYSLPIALATNEPNKWKSIDQVFNGFGYIGHTAFMLPGVKGLSPNGRNANGILKNIEQVSPEVRIEQYPDFTGNWCEFMDLTTGNHRNSEISVTYIQDKQPDVSKNSSNYAVWYSPSENIIRRTDNKGASWEKRNWILYAKALTSTERITSFSPKQPFRALDYNDFQGSPHLIHTYVNGTSGYRIWSDSYCEQWGKTSSKTVTLLKRYKDTNYNIKASSVGPRVGNSDYQLHVRPSNSSSFLIDGQWANGAYWGTCGYLAEGQY